MTSISVIILSFNEQMHIERCIRSLLPFAQKIFVVDAFSSDETVNIAKVLGAEVYQNKWINYSCQFNWALQNLPISTQWVMRMDADEYVEPELASEINLKLSTFSNGLSGIYLKRKVFFKGKWIRHGGFYPHVLLRIWRLGKGVCESRWMDEHITLSDGKTIKFEGHIVDDNKNNISWWTTKHNHYASREAVDLLNIRYKFLNLENNIEASVMGDKNQINRWLKEKVYTRLPFGIRPLLYFFYRYFIMLGFLDGFRGFVFCALQGFWYRLLVDVKVYEIETRLKKENIDIKTLIKEEFNLIL
ncbi:MAG: glycosyltransferase family 2 protein [Cytophagaceae bacterium]